MFNNQNDWAEYTPAVDVTPTPDSDSDSDSDSCNEPDVCGQTGREFDLRNPVQGCGINIYEMYGDENIMIGNISYCLKCGEQGMIDYPECVTDGCGELGELCGDDKYRCDACQKMALFFGTKICDLCQTGHCVTDINPRLVRR